ncbi:ATP-dependent Clp protease proteolytic subunit-related protein 4, chloroplastic [Cryptomeria japonica]|uniref:ATP-dependent Clp protease proteolytic subunit-related protein 4, chloroplastic n=1 Tax=Cryptomeria japonica TaxID=3369 RepID=UPI0025AB886E|nr:ATP-dependent Clp protease proteolytic subunit-related protein 4, chloroplastic [Cryptomeria japonica]
MDMSICTGGMRTKNFSIPPACSRVVNLKTKHARRYSAKVLNTKEGFNMRSPLKQSPVTWQEQISTVHRGLDLAFPHSRRDRDVAAHVIPFERESPRRSPPPDLASYFLSKRIIYLGWPLYWSVFELILGELIYLREEDSDKPVYMYINSTGSTKNGIKLASETQAIALHDVMRTASFPVYTLCVGNAWGEAALLLAAGAKGHRAALPSASIMIKQPIIAAQGQATDIDLARDEVTFGKDLMVKLWAHYTGHSRKKIAEDILRPKYFSPEEAIEYGLIDKVLYGKGKESEGRVLEDSAASLVSKAELI